MLILCETRRIKNSSNFLRSKISRPYRNLRSWIYLATKSNGFLCLWVVSEASPCCVSPGTRSVCSFYVFILRNFILDTQVIFLWQLKFILVRSPSYFSFPPLSLSSWWRWIYLLRYDWSVKQLDDVRDLLNLSSLTNLSGLRIEENPISRWTTMRRDLPPTFPSLRCQVFQSCNYLWGLRKRTRLWLYAEQSCFALIVGITIFVAFWGFCLYILLACCHHDNTALYERYNRILSPPPLNSCYLKS